jgi:hypothetical protein
MGVATGGLHMRRIALILAGFALVNLTPGFTTAPGWCAEGPFVVADTTDAVPLAIPSVAAEFGSFADVSEAVEADRQRMAALERRIQELESRKAAEPLPAPAGETGTGTSASKPDKEPDKTDSKSDKAQDAAKAEKKPPEPYEIGSDPNLSSKWVSGYQAESKQKDFRVKVGGRVQLDAVAFSAGANPNRPPNEGGLDPELADTVAFRRGRFRVEGRMYEFYDWAAEYDFVNQLNVNNETYPTERDSGPLTAVTDLWLQLARDSDPGHGPHRQPERSLWLRAPHEQPLAQLHGALVLPGRFRGPVQQWIRARHPGAQQQRGGRFRLAGRASSRT